MKLCQWMEQNAEKCMKAMYEEEMSQIMKMETFTEVDKLPSDGTKFQVFKERMLLNYQENDSSV